MATKKKAPVKKKAPTKKKAAPKPKVMLEVEGDSGSVTLAFLSEEARDSAAHYLKSSMGSVAKGLQLYIKDEFGTEFRYQTIKSISKL